jgi:myo-inositol-1(or 4)-monophosphatase
MLDLDALLPDVVAATRRAAIPVMDMFQEAIQVWDKDDGGKKAGGKVKNPLTEADLAADKALHEGLMALLPDAGWLSEETADTPERLQRDAVWIVDPIDGTREYMEGIPQFALSVGLSIGGQVALAVMLNPAKDDLFTAIAGQGAARNGAAMVGSTVDSMQGAVLLASRTEVRRGEFKPFEDRCTIRTVGSTAYKLALLAAGEGDAYFCRTPRNEWDVAAGILLCREAGLAVTDLGSQAHTFNRTSPLCRGVVGASRGIHAEIMAMIATEGTLED